MKNKVLFYVQHLLGIGHVKRAAAVVRAMTAAGLEVDVVLGGPPVPLADFGKARIHQLPAARAADAAFKVLVDENGAPIDDAWRENRRRCLADVFENVGPDLFLIELFPFGRRQFRFELIPLLEQINHSIPVVCSVREVLVARVKPSRDEIITNIVQSFFDRILVHGDESVIPLDETFPLVNRFREKLVYTGYVTDARPDPVETDLGSGEVIVSTGSGAVGEALLRAALAARPLSCMREMPWRLLAGDYLAKPVFEELRAQAPEGVTVEWARPDFRDLLPNCGLSVSLGGYNTVMDVLEAGCPAVIVPFADGDEGEQTYRARKFEKRGLLNLLEAPDLSPEALAAKIDAALTSHEAIRPDIDMAGAATAARLVHGLM